MPLLQIDLSITIQTALNVGGSGTLGTLADKNLLRDAWDRPILPGSQVKGRVRHACEALARTIYLDQPICRGPRPEQTCPHDTSVLSHAQDARRCLICEIFGSTFWPSPLQFHNLIYDPDLSTTARTAQFDPSQDLRDLRPGTSIERRRRVVQEQFLFLTETTLPGMQPVFQATAAIVGHLPTIRHAALVLAGLHQCNRWGAAKSRGLGWSTLGLCAHYADQVLVDSLHQDSIPMNWEVLRG